MPETVPGRTDNTRPVSVQTRARQPRQARPGPLSRRSPTRFGISCVAYHSSSWSSAPSTVNCASSSPVVRRAQRLGRRGHVRLRVVGVHVHGRRLGQRHGPGRSAPRRAPPGPAPGRGRRPRPRRARRRRRRPGAAAPPGRAASSRSEACAARFSAAYSSSSMSSERYHSRSAGRDGVRGRAARAPARPPCTPRRDRGGSGGRRRAWLAAFVSDRRTDAPLRRASGYVRASPFESRPPRRRRPPRPASHPARPAATASRRLPSPG